MVHNLALRQVTRFQLFSQDNTSVLKLSSCARIEEIQVHIDVKDTIQFNQFILVHQESHTTANAKPSKQLCGLIFGEAMEIPGAITLMPVIYYNIC